MDPGQIDGRFTLGINHLRKAYERGENVVHILTEHNSELPRSEVIEIAYDIQSGSYSKKALANPVRLKEYGHEIWELCKPHINDQDVILDCGTGELTSLSALSSHLPEKTRLMACDISLSRLRTGRRYAENFMRDDAFNSIKLFVADMANMPIINKAVDVVLTIHALEPNHGREGQLLNELLRIARRKLILFEPSWENANEAARARMDKHGYIRHLPQHIEAAGGRLVSAEPLPNPENPMNPTYCYVVEPVQAYDSNEDQSDEYQCPRSGFVLQKHHNYLWSQEGGWTYPIIDGIACLRSKHGILMSHA